jgi:hypothetical protein
MAASTKAMAFVDTANPAQNRPHTDFLCKAPLVGE